jgi:hypothetical protein
MTVRHTGPDAYAFRPLWAPEGEGAGGAGDTGTPTTAPAGTGTPPSSGSGSAPDQNGSVQFDAEKTFAELEPATRDWLQKKGLDKDPKVLARAAHEQEKMLGGMIKLPGKDATPEDLAAFYNRLGRPEKADGYDFKVPENLPEGLPYDGERAQWLKTELHKVGLTGAQAQAVHDLYVSDIVQQHGAGAQQLQQKAIAATEALTKRWGPLDGDTARANFEIADRVFTDVPGGQELLAELKTLGLVGPNKEVLSEPLALTLSAIGAALFKEDKVLRGSPDDVGNPFADASLNMTKQMALVKNDPDRARSLIAAAGKKPGDFGLK